MFSAGAAASVGRFFEVFFPGLVDLFLKWSGRGIARRRQIVFELFFLARN
jgi:hypothetical protein